MQSASSRIRTRVTVSILCDDNYCTTGAFSIDIKPQGTLIYIQPLRNDQF